jgi:dTDP-glucose 4,6-dehydratase
MSVDKKRILITGICGFIGHHTAEHILKTTDWDIVGIDMLSYATRGFERMRSAKIMENPRLNIITWDLCSPLSDGLIKEIGSINIILHMAAETHVDNSIKNPVSFILNNISSTLNVLEYARTLKDLESFLYFSTDEVFGPALNNISYLEWDRHSPTNPYSASKSASENICLSYNNTYKLPIIIVNVMNAFGERQHVEKYIPKVIDSILKGEEIQIHSDKDNIPGSRFYIHARNIASAVLFILNNGKIGDKYNITGEKEVDNLEMVKMISKIMNKTFKYKLVNFHADRPGHDLRYALNGEKMIEMGWDLPLTFYDSLEKTVNWTLSNKEWLNW